MVNLVTFSQGWKKTASLSAPSAQVNLAGAPAHSTASTWTTSSLGAAGRNRRRAPYVFSEDQALTVLRAHATTSYQAMQCSGAFHCTFHFWIRLLDYVPNHMAIVWCETCMHETWRIQKDETDTVASSPRCHQLQLKSSAIKLSSLLARATCMHVPSGMK